MGVSKMAAAFSIYPALALCPFWTLFASLFLWCDMYMKKIHISERTDRGPEAAYRQNSKYLMSLMPS